MCANRSWRLAFTQKTRCVHNSKLPWAQCLSNSCNQACSLVLLHQHLLFLQALVDRCHSLVPFLVKEVVVGLDSQVVFHLSKEVVVDRVVLNSFLLVLFMVCLPTCLELSHQALITLRCILSPLKLLEVPWEV